MADASGLTAAQADANQIPYKNIALGNPAETFLNAWALSTGLKLKQQEFEGKMSALQLKNAQIEADSAMKDKINEMRLAQMQQGMGMKEAYLGLREGKLQLDQSVFDNKKQDRSNMQDSMTQAESAFANQKSQPGDNDYMSDVDNTLAANRYLPPSYAARMRQQKLTQHRAAIDNQRKAIQSDLTAVTNDFKGTVWGNLQNNDLTPLKNPDQYPDVPGQLTPEQQAGLTWQQKWGLSAKPEAPPTGMKSIQQYVGGKPMGKPKQVSSQYLVDTAKRYQAAQDRLANLPAKPDDPSLGIFNARPLPPSKEAMQAGIYYNTANGPMQWDGTQLVPPPSQSQ